MNITEKQQKKDAKKFAEYWKDKGFEKGRSQKFWSGLLQNVYNVENATHLIGFEEQVHPDKSAGFMDGCIESTKAIRQVVLERVPIKMKYTSFRQNFTRTVSEILLESPHNHFMGTHDKTKLNIYNFTII